MNTGYDFDEPIDIAWCPGCGNFNIIASLKQAIISLGISRDRLVMVSGIGQAAKTPQYIRTNFFNAPKLPLPNTSPARAWRAPT